MRRIRLGSTFTCEYDVLYNFLGFFSGREENNGGDSELKIAIYSLASMLLVLPFLVGSTASAGEYDPWCDLDDDGDIDIFDVVSVAGRYGSAGTPINKTALLYEVNATLTELLSKIAELETQITILNATKLCMHADFDSGWFNISRGEEIIVTHYLNTTDVLVYMVGRVHNESSPYIHQINFGGDARDWPIVHANGAR